MDITEYERLAVFFFKLASSASSNFKSIKPYLIMKFLLKDYIFCTQLCNQFFQSI